MTPTRRLLNCVLWPVIAALVLGGTGFLCGYFGPLMLNPEANLGPLFGIFITGPLGTFLGLIFGIFAAARRLSPKTFAATLAVLSVASALSILYLCFPGDRFQDFVIDAETVACEQPTQFLAESIKRWEQSNAQDRWRTPRPGWKESIGDMTEHAHGVVLMMIVHRRWDIYEQQKPWNRGRLVSRPSEKRTRDRYFARGSCDGHRIGERARYAPKWEASSVSPPDVLPTFLGLNVLDDVPERYRSLLTR